MKDIQKVWVLWWLAGLPFIIASIVIIIVTGVTITASSQLTMEQFLLLVVTAVFAFVVFWRSDRLRHYNKTFAEYEENYRYEEEAQ